MKLFRGKSAEDAADAPVERAAEIVQGLAADVVPGEPLPLWARQSVHASDQLSPSATAPFDDLLAGQGNADQTLPDGWLRDNDDPFAALNEAPALTQTGAVGGAAGSMLTDPFADLAPAGTESADPFGDLGAGPDPATADVDEDPFAALEAAEPAAPQVGGGQETIAQPEAEHPPNEPQPIAAEETVDEIDQAADTEGSDDLATAEALADADGTEEVAAEAPADEQDEAAVQQVEPVAEDPAAAPVTDDEAADEPVAANEPPVVASRGPSDAVPLLQPRDSADSSGPQTFARPGGDHSIIGSFSQGLGEPQPSDQGGEEEFPHLPTIGAGAGTAESSPPEAAGSRTTGADWLSDIRKGQAGSGPTESIPVSESLWTPGSGEPAIPAHEPTGESAQAAPPAHDLWQALADAAGHASPGHSAGGATDVPTPRESADDPSWITPGSSE